MICGEQTAVADVTTCDNYQGTIDPSKDWSTITATETSEAVYRTTLGCRICKDDAQPFVTYLEPYGLHVMQCKDNEDIVEDAIDEPCGSGQITAMIGAIESLEELECTDCSTLIPNCLSCNSTDYCNLC